MYGMEVYAQVRLAVMADGMSRREAARRFGIDRKTVDKICACLLYTSDAADE